MAKINLKTILLIIFANSLITLVLPYLSLLISKNLNKTYELGFFNLVALYSLIIVILLIFFLIINFIFIYKFFFFFFYFKKKKKKKKLKKNFLKKNFFFKKLFKY